MLVALIIGVLEFAQPVDDYLRMARNMVRSKPPSGQIVVIGVDDRSLETIGVWPWPRQRHADLVETLSAAGAERIFFDLFLNSKPPTGENRNFINALSRAGNVYLAATRIRTGSSNVMKPKLPREEYRQHAKIVSVAARYSGNSAIKTMAMSTDFDEFVAPTMASEMARIYDTTGRRFPVDYAFDIEKIPFVSAVDVLLGRFDPEIVRGKSVVIAAASTEMGDVYYVPGRGQTNGVFVTIVAAETLIAGGTTHYGWLLPFLIMTAFAALNLFSPWRWLGRLAIVVGAAGVTIIPVVTEEHGIFFEVMPGMILLAATAGSRAWFSFKRSYKVRGNINAISGLPNLNALRGETPSDDSVVVSARVRNFAEITSSLPPQGERSLVDQVVARLALGARGARIHQGDEGIFVWIATPDVAGPDQLDALHALFRSPALIDGRSIDLSVTFGIDADAGRTLANRIGATLVAADEAAVEGARWKAYDPAKLADAEWKLSLLGRLDAAIDSGEVWVAYQPQLDLASGRLSGAEALVRWSHPEKGEVSPMEFVLAAEQHNRIDKLTAFVLDDAIRAAADFYAIGIAFDVAVNISARLLEKPGLVPMVQRMLAESGLPPERLTLEITESAALTTDRTSIRTLEEIGSLGINVSIDDYGTGFSTLEYFKRIPATEVKIDRSFVASIDRNAGDRLMVQSTIELAHSLGRSVVAEGVETQEILAELTKLGCDKIQGYLIGRPMKLQSLTKLIAGDAASQAA